MNPKKKTRLALLFYFLAVLLWVILMFIPSFVDRLSRHEKSWLDGGGRHVTELPIEKTSDKD